MLSDRAVSSDFKLYGWLAVIMVLAIGLDLGGWLWVKKASLDFSQKQQFMVGLSQKRINFFQIKREHEKNIGQQENIIPSFVPQDNVVAFVLFLENVASQANVSIVVRSVSSSEDENSAKARLHFKVELKGDYPRLVDFLRRLENSPMLAAFSKIEIFSVPGPAAGEILRANLELIALTRNAD